MPVLPPISSSLMLTISLGEKKKKKSRKGMTCGIIMRHLSDYLLLSASVKKKWAAEPVPFKGNLSSPFSGTALSWRRISLVTVTTFTQQ